MKSLNDTINETILTRKLSDSKLLIIKEWLEEYGITNYTIKPNYEIDVKEDVNIINKDLKEFPEYIQFGVVEGYFICNYNKLISLRGCPKRVEKNFYCNNNKLKSLEGGPRIVKGSYYCQSNKLTTLKGGPEDVGGNFYCNNNKLTSLEGCPVRVEGDFNCSINKLTSLEGAPKMIGRNFYCNNNPTKFTKEDIISNVKGMISL